MLSEKFSPLESIIKIEPEEFQEIENVDENPNKCKICLKTFAYLKEHMENIHNKSNKMFCDHCPKVFFTRPAIIQHVRAAHRTKTFACNICDYKTCFRSFLRSHLLIHAEKVECPVCKKQVTVLKHHMKNHREKKSCPICGRMLLKYLLGKHIRNHSKKPFKCQKCEESFEFRRDLYLHDLKTHYDGNLYLCHCGATYNSPQALAVHIRHIHQKGKIKCKVCQTQCATQATMKRHWIGKHFQTHGKYDNLRMPVLNRIGPFFCDKCGSKNNSRKTFLRHIAQRHAKYQI